MILYLLDPHFVVLFMLTLNQQYCFLETLMYNYSSCLLGWLLLETFYSQTDCLVATG